MLKTRIKVVSCPAQAVQGDLPCHASNASNKAFSKAVSERSRSGDARHTLTRAYRPPDCVSQGAGWVMFEWITRGSAKLDSSGR